MNEIENINHTLLILYLHNLPFSAENMAHQLQREGKVTTKHDTQRWLDQLHESKLANFFVEAERTYYTITSKAKTFIDSLSDELRENCYIYYLKSTNEMPITKATGDSMSEDDKMSQAKRLIPLIKPFLPKYKQFSVWEIHNVANLNDEDSQILLKVQNEITKLLVYSEMYKYSRPHESLYHIERIPIEEDAELKHSILNYLITRPGWHFAKDIMAELNLNYDTAQYLASEMASEQSVELKDISSKEGPDFYIQISGIGKGQFLKEYYLKPNRIKQAVVNFNDNSVKLTGTGNINAPSNKGTITSHIVENKDNSLMKTEIEDNFTGDLKGNVHNGEGDIFTKKIPNTQSKSEPGTKRKHYILFIFIVLNLVALVLAGIWSFTSNWDYEPLITFVGLIISLIALLISKSKH